MTASIISREDLNYLAQQSSGNLNMILSGMTALMNDTDNKVAMMENQTWFQRMCRTISGKNKMTQQEIQRNHDKINMYMSQAMTELFEQQCIDHQIMMSLGNQLNELYAEHLQLKQMLGAFVTKLNEKIESIDNFHMLNTEIEQGIYSDCSPIVSICKILSQIDKRCIQDDRKMNILQRTMSNQNILNDIQTTLADYLINIIEIPMDEVGTIYIELGSLRGNFMANIILSMIENYHFLPDMARKLKNKQSLVESVIASEQLEPSITLSINDVYRDFVNSKKDMIEGLIPISFIQYDTKMREAEALFLEYKLDEAFELFHTLAEKGNGRAMYFVSEYYIQGYGKTIEDEEKAEEWCMKGRDAGDVLASLNTTFFLSEDDPEQEEVYNNIFDSVLALAENEDVIAQYLLSLMYANGWGCAKNSEKGRHWLEASAKGGYWLAMLLVGDIFLDKDNYVKAMEWFKMAADIGCREAQFQMGNLLSWKGDLPKDNRKANEWYRKAAEQGDCASMFNLGLSYYEGKGCDVDYSKALECFMKAATLGFPDAMNGVAVCYEFGDGCERNEDKAKEWAMKAADAGNQNAINNLKEWFDIDFE